MNSLNNNRHGLLLIVSGPAGSGKTTLCDQLLAEFAPRLTRVVTATSRPPRPGEVDGTDYHFLSAEDFERKVQAGDFYEHARVHTNRYGVLREAVLKDLEKRDLLLNIDVQGASTFRKSARTDSRIGGLLASVFIMPESIDQIRERLVGRASDDEAEISRRLETAKAEICEWRNYDYRIVSGSREQDYASIRAIYLAETLRAARMA